MLPPPCATVLGRVAGVWRVWQVCGRCVESVAGVLSVSNEGMSSVAGVTRRCVKCGR